VSDVSLDMNGHRPRQDVSSVAAISVTIDVLVLTRCDIPAESM